MTDSSPPDASPEMLARLAEVRAAIARALADSGRPAGAASLVAVSKLFGPEAIHPVLEAGQRLFGENYVQEAKAKWPDLRAAWPDARLHLIGPLQSNKAREAVALFDVIETLDRESLALALAKEIARARDAGQRVPTLLVQVNTGDEPQKGGIGTAEADAFIARCREVHGLEIGGLMCIPPADQPPSPHFAFLARLGRAHGLATLSMGMSADFAAAIQLGATHVRVGSAIFGARG